MTTHDHDDLEKSFHWNVAEDVVVAAAIVVRRGLEVAESSLPVLRFKPRVRGSNGSFYNCVEVSSCRGHQKAVLLN